MSPLLILLLLYTLAPQISPTATNASCPAPAKGKIPTKCAACFQQIIKRINKTDILSQNTMYGFANNIGNYIQSWIKNRTQAGNKDVPSMCEIGNAIKDYVSAHMNELLACVAQYNSGTAAQVASDVTQVGIAIAVNGFNLSVIADGAVCGAMQCLQGAYKTDFTKFYKQWVNQEANFSTIQNQVCKLCASYIADTALIQKCFNDVKARTQVAVLQQLYDKFIPHYLGVYQSFRDKSTVACMTQPLQCNCEIDVSGLASQAENAEG